MGRDGGRTVKTDTLTGAQILEALFQDFELPCDYGHGPQWITETPCESTADWALINACCGTTVLRCEHHLRKCQEHLATTGVHCSRCDHVWLPGALLTDRYSRIERIGR
jgi:spermidine synthase